LVIIAPNRALGYADNGSLVTVRYTVNGDASLDGLVSIVDINIAKANFGGSGDVWTTALVTLMSAMVVVPS
jgi:hypothetical protein